MALGGRVAEEEAFDEVTTGAQDDIKRATRFARAMVCELGMSKKLGPVAYGEHDDNVFLGREMASRREDYSEKTASEIDSEVRSIIDKQYELARQVIRDNRDKLDRLAEALLERETLDAEEIQAAIDDAPLPKRERVVIPTWAERQNQAKPEKKRPASIFGAPKPAASS
jgi:cell division protease FtsH